ncbi:MULTISPECIES: hypothetical protein [unclassified Leptolyngbya]|uniref:hypothetical protein n=1 Tax=unclassified Leptolyngbya TaxID=2650499 RepID=UPI001687D8A3|nr:MULTISPECIES: hypothetical protein [unclassified Leptolyngbya]MBD1913222.1 hypothetical protein [Leptolyngbya sp. FACHB-8]MBD2153388.1 hypothetical protein [Leptolyngbya sp. FACHB-16]
MVKANWDKEKLSENWTLLPTELNLVGKKLARIIAFTSGDRQVSGILSRTLCAVTSRISIAIITLAELLIS